MHSRQHPVDIALARKDELPAGAALLAASLGFSEPDSIPAWLIHTTTSRGGIALAARDGNRLVGFSYAFPAVAAGEGYLFSCGLAVAPEYRGRGIARALKHRQRDQAVRMGLRSIRWTADPLAAGPLYIYLTQLGAVLTGYHAGLYSGIRDSSPPEQDDVEIEWRIDVDGEPVPSDPTDGQAYGEQTKALGHGLRRLVDPGPTRSGGAWLLEIPWDAGRLLASHPAAACEWRVAVRDAMRQLIADGAVGVAVEVDRSAKRAFLRFERVGGRFGRRRRTRGASSVVRSS